MHIFLAGNDLVRWEVTALTQDGPYRLTMHHSRGSIVEYFHDMTTAMAREAELEDLLVIAGTQGRSPEASWITVAGGTH